MTSIFHTTLCKETLQPGKWKKPSTLFFNSNWTSVQFKCSHLHFRRKIYFYSPCFKPDAFNSFNQLIKIPNMTTLQVNLVSEWRLDFICRRLTFYLRTNNEVQYLIAILYIHQKLECLYSSIKASIIK